MAQNLIEKIAGHFAVDVDEPSSVKSGDYISIRPLHILTHDNTGAVVPKFKSIGAKKIANPRQVVFALDHGIQDKSESTINKYKNIESFAREMGVDFYPAGRGIGHQIMIEEGYVWPGTMLVASDSHSNTYGGLGCLGTPVVRTDAAAIWATTRTWWQVPPVVKVKLTGYLREGVTGKDLIITLCGIFNKDEVLNHAIEFSGSGAETLSIEDRFAIANMTTEWGALAGVFPADKVTCTWIKKRAEYIKKRGPAGVPSDEDGENDNSNPRFDANRIKDLEEAYERGHLSPDADARYAKEIEINLATIIPYISGPHNLKIATPAYKLATKIIKINKAYLVSCVNARLSDLTEAAHVLKGRKIASHVKLFVAAASSEIQKQSEASGDWQNILASGATPLPPGCGPCIGLGTGLLEDNEVGISATNRNFKGRMGSKSAEVYLASPKVVAESAIKGYIDMPGFLKSFNDLPKANISLSEVKKESAATVNLMEEFPEFFEGEIIFCHQDNLNTDAIYPGKYTYNDDFKPKDQALVAMENYDPEFQKLIKTGDFLVGGYNFGSGSSREQAATALKYRGIRLVIAGSFSETYKRNAINNGFLVIDVPELVNDLKSTFGTNKLTVKTEIKAKLDVKKSTISVEDKTYSINPIGTAAQELIILGGLENWVKKNINPKGEING